MASGKYRSGGPGMPSSCHPRPGFRLVAQAERSRSAPAGDADALPVAAGRHVNVAPDIILRAEEATRVGIGASPTESRGLGDTS